MCCADCIIPYSFMAPASCTSMSQGQIEMKKGGFLFWAKNRMVSLISPHATQNRCSRLQNRLLHGLKQLQGLVGRFLILFCSVRGSCRKCLRHQVPQGGFMSLSLVK